MLRQPARTILALALVAGALTLTRADDLDAWRSMSVYQVSQSTVARTTASTVLIRQVVRP